MNKERLMKVLLAPVVSEKSANAGEAGQVVFRVVIDASKPEIKRAVETMFDVNVEQVRVVKVKGKNKRFGAMMGRRKDWKKAYVRLQEGQDIDFSAGA
jgi:large subunit ribosomal protein L23